MMIGWINKESIACNKENNFSSSSPPSSLRLSYQVTISQYQLRTRLLQVTRLFGYITSYTLNYIYMLPGKRSG